MTFNRAMTAYKEGAESVNRTVDQILTSRNLDPHTHTIKRVNGELEIAEITAGIEPVGSLRPDAGRVSEWESVRGRSGQLYEE